MSSHRLISKARLLKRAAQHQRHLMMLPQQQQQQQQRRAFSNRTRAVLGAVSRTRPSRAAKPALKAQLNPTTATAASAAATDLASKRSGATANQTRGSQALRTTTRYDHSMLHSPSNWQAVVFDKDGTLVDKRAAYIEWGRVIGAHYEEHCGAEATQRLFEMLRFNAKDGIAHGDGILAMRPWNEVYDTVSGELSRHTGMQFHHASALVCGWRAEVDLASNQTPMVDVAGLFASLKNMGIKVAVVTSDDRDVTTQVLNDMGALSMVDVLVTGSDAFAPKPQPASAHYITRRLQVLPEKCIMIGDTLADLLYARNAGFGLGAAVLSGSGTREQLHSYTDILVSSATSVLDIVRGGDVAKAQSESDVSMATAAVAAAASVTGAAVERAQAAVTNAVNHRQQQQQQQQQQHPVTPAVENMA